MKIIFYIAVLFSVLPTYGQYRLDSVIHIQYDRLTKVAQQVDSSSGIWLKSYTQLDRKSNALLDGTRQWKGVDQNGNEVLSIFSEWNAETAEWDEKEKHESAFDGNNQLISTSESVYTPTGWQVQAFDTILYNQDSVVTTADIYGKPSSRNVSYLIAKGRDYLSINYQWNEKERIWTPWMKSTWSYRQDSIIQEASTYQWKDGMWKPSERTTYLFDKNGEQSIGSIMYTGYENGWQASSKTSGADFLEQRLRTDTLYRWSREGSSWIPDVIYRTYLNEKNKETDYLVLKVRRDTTEVLHERMTMYNDQGKVTLRQEIYFEHNKPVRGFQQTYRFDDNDNVLQYTTWELDVHTDQWQEKKQIDFIFRPDISLSGSSSVLDSFQIGIYNDQATNNAISEAKVYHFDDNNRKLYEQVLYYYSPVNANP